MNLRHIDSFCKIVELGSFTKAADNVQLSQPTLSEHIKYLEDYFGTKLLDRKDRIVTATQAGKLFYGYAKKILSLKIEAEKSMQLYNDRMEGKVEIGASTIPGEYILPPLLQDFRDKYPGIIVELYIGDTKEIVSKVLDNLTELGIVGAKIENPKLRYQKFVDDELVLISPLYSDWIDKDSITPDRLMDIPFIIRENGSGTRIMIEKRFRDSGIDTSKLNIVGVMGSTMSVIQGVKNGMGHSIVSMRAASSVINEKELRIIKIRDIDLIREFYIVTRHGKTHSPIAEAFINFIEY